MRKIFFIMILLSFHIFTFAQYNAPYFQIGQTNTHQVIPIETLFRSDTTLTLQDNIDIYGLSISGDAIILDDKSSYVRVTMTDQYNIEHLVYETYSLLADDEVVEFSNVAMETSLLDGVKPQSLTISLENAYLRISNIIYQLFDISNGDYIEMKRAYGQMQNSYIIDLLNEKLEAKGELWRAGETTISKMSYDDKKEHFGGRTPLLYGFEYYKGGVFKIPPFVDPTGDLVVPNDTSLYVKEWDWRYRHGQNWSTSIKNQGGCGSCWIFAPVAATELFANIYFNKQLNLDLSEQQYVSCIPPYSNSKLGGCGGGSIRYSLQNLVQKGIVTEECFPYETSYVPCKICNNPADVIKLKGFYQFDLLEKSEEDLKSSIIKSPGVISIQSWTHALALLGYRKLEVGDSCKIRSGNTDIWVKISPVHLIKSNNAYLVKNSWGDDWGDNGYAYIMVDFNTESTELSNTYNIYFLKDGVTSKIYSNEDILIIDRDGDGYYTWGVGDKPTTLSNYIPSEQDGDDNNIDYGPIDEYGKLIPIVYNENDAIIINNEQSWVDDNYLYKDIIIESGGTLTIASTIKMYPKAKIIVKSGGKLIINAGIVANANILTYPNSELILSNGAKLLLSDKGNLSIALGAKFKNNGGTIK